MHTAVSNQYSQRGQICQSMTWWEEGEREKASTEIITLPSTAAAPADTKRENTLEYISEWEAAAGRGQSIENRTEWTAAAAMKNMETAAAVAAN